MGKTTINWADYTFNPWHGCTKVSAGCDHCYAETLDRRHLHSKKEHWGPGVERLIMGDLIWEQPHVWNRKALRDGAGRPESSAHRWPIGPMRKLRTNRETTCGTLA